MATIESPRFPDDISYGSRGGPSWNTSVIVMNSGYEKRNKNWTNARYAYDVSYGIKTQTELLALVDFFNRVNGKADGFRFKDHADYQATDEALVPDGSPTIQLIRTYGSGANTWVRNITKPIAGSTFKRGGSPLVSISPSVDTTTGIITLPADSSAVITNITQSASTSPESYGVVTTGAAHGYSNGDEIYIIGVQGMTEVNGIVFTISAVTATTFELGVDTSAYTAFTSTSPQTGTASKYVQSTEQLLWTGTFDVPVRFDTDTLQTSLDDYLGGGAQVPLVEIRI